MQMPSAFAPIGKLLRAWSKLSTCLQNRTMTSVYFLPHQCVAQSNWTQMAKQKHMVSLLPVGKGGRSSVWHSPDICLSIFPQFGTPENLYTGDKAECNFKLFTIVLMCSNSYLCVNLGWSPDEGCQGSGKTGNLSKNPVGIAFIKNNAKVQPDHHRTCGSNQIHAVVHLKLWI